MRQTMSDLIERDKAINILDVIDVDIIPYADTRKYVQIAIDHIRKELENIPSARPKGEWIYQFRDSENEEYRCSVCGFPQGFKPNFCPNCGARMQEETSQ